MLIGMWRTSESIPSVPAGAAHEKLRCGTMTHFYKRHGTTTRFAALDVLNGRLIGECMGLASPSGVPALLTAVGARNFRGDATASHRRQLWDSQAKQGEGVVG